MSSSLRADVGQLLWVGFQGVEMAHALERRIGAGEVGAVVLFKRNLRIQNDLVDVDALIELNRALHAAAPAGLPILSCVDQEGGRVQRVKAPATVWPPMLHLDQLDADAAAAQAEAIGLALGRELRGFGFDVDFAPVLDVHTNPANPIIGDRAFSTEPERAARTALAFAAGLARAGILSCGKHFPGHGDTSTDSHLELPRLDHDLARLEAVELLPFRRAAAAGLPMLMTAHVLFAALDPDRPATLSPRVIDQLLRRDIGYRGLIVSDDLDMRAIADHFGVGDAAVAALRAGCDVLLLCNDEAHQEEAWEALLRAGEADPAFRARLATAAAAVRALKGGRS